MENLGAKTFNSFEEAFAFVKERQIVEPETGVTIDPYEGYLGVNWSTQKDADFVKAKFLQHMKPNDPFEEDAPDDNCVRLSAETFYVVWMRGESGNHSLGLVTRSSEDFPFLRDLLDESLDTPSDHALDSIIVSARSILETD